MGCRILELMGGCVWVGAAVLAVLFGGALFRKAAAWGGGGTRTFDRNGARWRVRRRAPLFGMRLTVVEADIGFPAFFEATSKSSIRPVTRFGRMVLLPDPKRPRPVRILTTDGAWAALLLEEGLDRVLERLDAWAGRPVRVQLTAGRAAIEVEGMVPASRREELCIYLDRIIAVATGIRKGVKLQGVRERPEEGLCPVCACALEGARVKCVRCATLHHRECWRYVGGCAIFACGARRARTG